MKKSSRHHSHVSQQFSRQMPIQKDKGKSKIILLLIEMFVGCFGFDRMYMECYAEGFAKLFLFISIFILFPLSPIAGVIVLSAWLLWTLFDYVVVIGNALARSQHTPWTFCRKSQWGRNGEIQNGFIFAVCIVLFHIACIVAVPISLGGGTKAKPEMLPTPSP